MSMSRFPTPSALAAAIALALLLGGCASAPQKSVETAAVPESNEPDLVAQLRERMAAGNLPRKAKTAPTGPIAATGDTSSAPTVKVDPAKQQAAMAVGADYARSLSLMKAGGDAEALALLRQIGDKVPQFSGPLVNQGVILLRQQKYAEAEKALRAALKANPGSPYAHNLLGIALREQGKFTDAKAAYQAAIALDPGYAKAHFNLGVLADLYMQDLTLALSHYEKYQSLQSKPDPAVANWIIDMQKRTGVYKAPPRPAPVQPVATPDEPAASDAAPGTTPEASTTDTAEQKTPS